MEKFCVFALLPPFLLQINGNDLREVPHQTAVSFFHNTGEVVTLLVERGAEHRIRVGASCIAPLGVFFAYADLGISSKYFVANVCFLKVTAKN